jgi:hypothetical protein
MSATVVDLKGGKYKIAREVAEQEFVRLCEANRVDHDTSEMNEAELKDWTDLRSEIVRDIQRGSLIVAEDGKPTYTPPGAAKGYTFHPPTGATLIALETVAGKQLTNFVAAMADMTRTDRSDFGKMDLRDVKACMRVARLFLGQG